MIICTDRIGCRKKYFKKVFLNNHKTTISINFKNADIAEPSDLCHARVRRSHHSVLFKCFSNASEFS